MSFRRQRSLSPEEFRQAIDAIADRSAEELAQSQLRMSDLRPTRKAA